MTSSAHSVNQYLQCVYMYVGIIKYTSTMYMYINMQEFVKPNPLKRHVQEETPVDSTVTLVHVPVIHDTCDE